jgi:hypothetical protein
VKGDLQRSQKQWGDSVAISVFKIAAHSNQFVSQRDIALGGCEVEEGLLVLFTENVAFAIHVLQLSEGWGQDAKHRAD